MKLKYFLQEMWYLSPAVFPGIPSAWMLGEFMLGWVQLVDWFGLDGSIGLVGLGWVGLCFDCGWFCIWGRLVGRQNFLFWGGWGGV